VGITTNKQSTDCTVGERERVDRARFVFTCVACIDYVFIFFGEKLEVVFLEILVADSIIFCYYISNFVF
jgi:hypothetical protein